MPVNNDIRTMSFENFYDQHKSDLINFAFLFGNGFIKSYPESAPCSKNVRHSVELEENGVMLAIWEETKKDIEKNDMRISYPNQKVIELKMPPVARSYEECLSMKGVNAIGAIC